MALNDIIKLLKTKITKDRQATDLDTNIGITANRMQKMRFTNIINKTNDKIEEIIRKSTEQKNISMPENISALFNTMRTMYTSIPEFYQAVSTIVDNLLSPDSSSKEVLTILVDEEDETLRNQQYVLIKTIVDSLNIEDKIIDIATDFILYGNAYVWIRTPEEVSDSAILKNSLNLSKKSLQYISETFKMTYVVPPKRALTETSFYQILKLKEDYATKKVEKTLNNVVLDKLDVSTTIPLYIGNVFCGVLCITSQNTQYANSATPSQMIKNYSNVTSGTDINSISLEISKGIVNMIKQKIHQDFDDVSFAELTYSVISNLIKGNQTLTGSKFISKDYIVHFRIPSSILPHGFGEPYGMGVVSIAKYMIACDMAQLIYRLTRAGERRTFKVNVGEDQRASVYIQEIINQTKRKEYAVRNATDTDTLINEVTMFDDYYIPVYNGEEPLTIDVQSGGDMSNKIEDLEYFRKKFISGLGIPSIYLVQDDTPESKYTLSQENIKFSRTIIKLQKYFDKGLSELVRSLVSHIFKVDLQTFSGELHLKPPRALQIERDSEMIQNMSNLINQLREIAPENFRTDDFIEDVLTDLFGQSYFANNKLSKLTQSKLSGKSSKEEEGTGTSPGGLDLNI